MQRSTSLPFQGKRTALSLPHFRGTADINSVTLSFKGQGWREGTFSISLSLVIGTGLGRRHLLNPPSASCDGEGTFLIPLSLVRGRGKGRG